MVGTNRSLGCQTCRQRRKKCGLENPRCAACVKSGWSCPGYTKSYRFVNENSRLKRELAAKRYLFASNDLYENEYSPDVQIITLAFVRSPRASYSARLQSMLTHILTDNRSATVLSTQVVGTFLPFVPLRIGINEALDTAVHCLYHAYRERATASSHVSPQTLTAYVQALDMLQIYISEPKLRTEIETICASVIIQYCELLVADSSTQRYGKLIIGSRALLQAVSRRSRDSDLELAIVDLLQAPFIAQDAAGEGDSFVSNHISMFKHHATQNDSTVKIIRLRSQFSSLLREYTSIGTNQYPLSSSDVSARVAKLYKKLTLWYTVSFWPVIRSESLEYLHPFQTGAERRYGDPLLAMLDCISCSLFLLLESASPIVEDSSFGYRIATDKEIVQKIADNAQNMVLTTSHVTAECLRFGLHRLKRMPFYMKTMANKDQKLSIEA